MAQDFDRAYEVRSLSLSNKVGVFAGSGAPSEEDDGSWPLGSLYLKDSGETYQKTAMPTTYVLQGAGGGTNLEFAEFHVDANGDLILSYYGSADANDFNINANGELEVQI